MTIRVSVPGKPIQHIDLGYGVGRRHWYVEAREDFDAKLSRPQRHEPMVLPKR